MTSENEKSKYDRNIQARISKLIACSKEGTVFIFSDFADITIPSSIRVVFARLEKLGILRKVLPGLYERPRYSKLLAEYVAPDYLEVAHALARKHGWRIAPSGATALNQLRLSTQVPSKYEFVSDGPYKEYTCGRTSLKFKHTANKELAGLSEFSCMVIQSLKALGEHGITDHTIRHLSTTLSEEEKWILLSEAKHTTSWVYEIIKKIAGKMLYNEYIESLLNR